VQAPPGRVLDLQESLTSVVQKAIPFRGRNFHPLIVDPDDSAKLTQYIEEKARADDRTARCTGRTDTHSEAGL